MSARVVLGAQQLDAWFLLLMTGVLLGIFAIIQPGWLNGQLLQILISENAPLALVALAMTFSIISRHIDLSPGSMVALVGIVIGLVSQSTGSIALGLLAGVGVALGTALVHALLVVGFGLNTIMVTLAAYIWASGLAVGANNGNPVVVNGELPRIVNASFHSFTLTAPLVVVAYIGGSFLLRRTKMGRYTHAMGGDPQAARRAGINTALYTTLIFVLMGAMIAISSIITVGQLSSAQSTSGSGLELDAIIAVVIGGSRLVGGDGSVGRTLLGVIFLSVLDSGLLNLGLGDASYQLYRGTALLSILAVQALVRRWTSEEERRRLQREQLEALPA